LFGFLGLFGLFGLFVTGVRYRRPGARRPPLPLRRLTAQVVELLLQLRDLDIALGHGACNGLQRLIRDAHVIAPRSGRRAQQRDIGRGDRAEVDRRIVRVFRGDLAAASRGDDDDAGQDDDRRDEDEHKHVMNRATAGKCRGN
jgi:hypothetical protein